MAERRAPPPARIVCNIPIIEPLGDAWAGQADPRIIRLRAKLQGMLAARNLPMIEATEADLVNLRNLMAEAIEREPPGPLVDACIRVQWMVERGLNMASRDDGDPWAIKRADEAMASRGWV